MVVLSPAPRIGPPIRTRPCVIERRTTTQRHTPVATAMTALVIAVGSPEPPPPQTIDAYFHVGIPSERASVDGTDASPQYEENPSISVTSTPASAQAARIARTASVISPRSLSVPRL